MEQRQRVHQHVIGGPPPCRQRRPDRHRQLTVGQRNPLGPPGGAGGVGQQRRIPRPRRPLIPNAPARPVGTGRRRRPGRSATAPHRAAASQPGRRAGVSQGGHRTGVGHQVTEFGRGVPRDWPAPPPGPPAARPGNSAGSQGWTRRPAALGRPVRCGRPARPPPGRPGIQPGVGDRLPGHGERDPVREALRRLGRQVWDGLLAQPLDQLVKVSTRRTEMSPPARAAPFGRQPPGGGGRPAVTHGAAGRAGVAQAARLATRSARSPSSSPPAATRLTAPGTPAPRASTCSASMAAACPGSA